MKIRTQVNVTSENERYPIDIIIPYHGQYHRVLKLIDSIFTHVKSNPYQITLIDDFSPSEHLYQQFLNFDKERPSGSLAVVQSIRNKQQLGFGGSFNAGLSATKQKIVLGLHSDCVIEEPNMILEMIRTLKEFKEQKVEMVVPKSTNGMNGCDSRLKGDKFMSTDDAIVETGFLPLYCFLTRRTLFDRIGPVKSYPYTGYEDEEFSYRLRKHEFNQAICGKAWINHEGGGTINSLLKKTKIRNEVAQNRERCIQDMKAL